MTKAELDYILGTMLDSRENVSDLNLSVDKTLQVESSGELVPVPFEPQIERLTPFQTEAIAMQIIDRDRRLTDDLIKNGSCDCSYSLGQKARFRVNIFSQRGNYSIILRKLTTEIPTLDQLNLPPVFHNMAKEKTGLILVTGGTGSGKSTTLAALLNELNESKPIHVVTLEDPVEFVHPQKQATFNQRELGMDFINFPAGLRAAMRQAPKVILVGEMRDRETMEIGMSAGGNRTPCDEHPAHHRCRTDDQPYRRHVRSGRREANPHPSGGNDPLGRLPTACFPKSEEAAWLRLKSWGPVFV
jgi:twitching motility protein PilT